MKHLHALSQAHTSLVNKHLALWQTADAYRLQVEPHIPRIHFTNRDGLKLAGTMELPPGAAWQATALFAHCFTCTRNIRAARDITRELAAAGFAVLRFDFTGLGESEGEFTGTDFASNLDDLEDAARHLAEGYAAPQLLVGDSLGGTAAVAVAERIETEGSANVELAGRCFFISIRLRNCSGPRCIQRVLSASARWTTCSAALKIRVMWAT